MPLTVGHVADGEIPLEGSRIQRLPGRLEHEQDVAVGCDWHVDTSLDLRHRHDAVDNRRHARVDHHAYAEAVSTVTRRKTRRDVDDARGRNRREGDIEQVAHLEPGGLPPRSAGTAELDGIAGRAHSRLFAQVAHHLSRHRVERRRLNDRPRVVAHAGREIAGVLRHLVVVVAVAIGHAPHVRHVDGYDVLRDHDVGRIQGNILDRRIARVRPRVLARVARGHELPVGVARQDADPGSHAVEGRARPFEVVAPRRARERVGVLPHVVAPLGVGHGARAGRGDVDRLAPTGRHDREHRKKAEDLVHLSMFLQTSIQTAHRGQGRVWAKSRKTSKICSKSSCKEKK